ncbi:DEAD/DEAH box helicase [Xylariomycetidae sp. FL2044]|nr:DEAD/DEAH box helicase [Xylariomycetidae sp. FL2044]
MPPRLLQHRGFSAPPIMAPDLKDKRRDPRAWDALQPELADWVKDAVASMGFAKATPVQAAVWPRFGAGKSGTRFCRGNNDVVVEAVTGSGKTFAYLLPIVSRILGEGEPTKTRHISSIIVSPTRELAIQIHDAVRSLVAFHPPSADLAQYLDGEEKRPVSTVPFIVPQLLTGGNTTTTDQDRSFFIRHSPNVIVSTPGRLVELLSSSHVHCPQSSFDVLVLDEADKLLGPSFEKDMKSILSRLPKQRRTGLFSASVSEAMGGQLIRVGLRHAARIQVRVKSLMTGGNVEERRTPASLQMCYLITPAHHKLPSLAQLLDKLNPAPQRSIVFFSTCAAVNYFSKVLPSLLSDGFQTMRLHGKDTTDVRKRGLEAFKNSTKPSVLLTTELGARGLDVAEVDLVVQVDPPSDPKSFIHRCGRAGRAGRKGLSVVFIQPNETDYVPYLEVRKTPITPLTHPEIAVTEVEADKITGKIRDIVKKDRALHDLAQQAFPSWVKSYSKHSARSIFRMADLDWTELGRAWGLLQLPKMPEAKSFDGHTSFGLSVDWDKYKYQNKEKEKRRQAALAEGIPINAKQDAKRLAVTEDLRKKRKRNTEAWSDKHEREDARAGRREKRRKRRDTERKLALSEEDKNKEKDLETLLAEVRRMNKEKHATNQDEGGDEFQGFA